MTGCLRREKEQQREAVAMTSLHPLSSSSSTLAPLIISSSWCCSRGMSSVMKYSSTISTNTVQSSSMSSYDCPLKSSMSLLLRCSSWKPQSCCWQSVGQALMRVSHSRWMVSQNQMARLWILHLMKTRQASKTTKEDLLIRCIFQDNCKTLPLIGNYYLTALNPQVSRVASSQETADIISSSFFSDEIVSDSPCTIRQIAQPTPSLLMSFRPFTILMSRLMMGHSMVGEPANSGILTKPTMLEMHEASTQMERSPSSIVLMRLLSPKAHWQITSAVLSPVTGVATTLARSPKISLAMAGERQEWYLRTILARQLNCLTSQRALMTWQTSSTGSSGSPQMGGSTMTTSRMLAMSCWLKESVLSLSCCTLETMALRVGRHSAWKHLIMVRSRVMQCWQTLLSGWSAAITSQSYSTVSTLRLLWSYSTCGAVITWATSTSSSWGTSWGEQTSLKARWHCCCRAVLSQSWVLLEAAEARNSSGFWQQGKQVKGLKLATSMVVSSLSVRQKWGLGSLLARKSTRRRRQSLRKSEKRKGKQFCSLPTCSSTPTRYFSTCTRTSPSRSPNSYKMRLNSTMRSAQVRTMALVSGLYWQAAGMAPSAQSTTLSTFLRCSKSWGTPVEMALRWSCWERGRLSWMRGAMNCTNFSSLCPSRLLLYSLRAALQVDSTTPTCAFLSTPSRSVARRWASWVRELRMNWWSSPQSCGQSTRARQPTSWLKCLQCLSPCRKYASMMLFRSQALPWGVIPWGDRRWLQLRLRTLVRRRRAESWRWGAVAAEQMARRVVEKAGLASQAARKSLAALICPWLAPCVTITVRASTTCWQLAWCASIHSYNNIAPMLLLSTCLYLQQVLVDVGGDRAQGHRNTLPRYRPQDQRQQQRHRQRVLQEPVPPLQRALQGKGQLAAHSPLYQPGGLEALRRHPQLQHSKRTQQRRPQFRQLRQKEKPAVLHPGQVAAGELLRAAGGQHHDLLLPDKGEPGGEREEHRHQGDKGTEVQ